VPLPDTDQPDQPDYTARSASRRMHRMGNYGPCWHVLCNISSVARRSDDATNETAVSALETQRAEGQGNEIHVHDDSGPAQAPA
jgi:hypothetical protein